MAVKVSLLLDHSACEPFACCHGLLASNFTTMKKELTSGTKAPVSAQYEIVNRVGNRTGIERTVTKGEPLPPTPKSGQTYRIADETKH